MPMAFPTGGPLSPGSIDPMMGQQQNESQLLNELIALSLAGMPPGEAGSMMPPEPTTNPQTDTLLRALMGEDEGMMIGMPGMMGPPGGMMPGAMPRPSVGIPRPPMGAY